MFICTIGFLIYWIISMHGRMLQFGIFRAIGMSQKNVIQILILEQLLTSGVAIILGIIIGGIASVLFVPVLQLVFSSVEQVPPFIIIKNREDYLKIYFIISSIGFFLLFFIKHHNVVFISSPLFRIRILHLRYLYCLLRFPE